MKKMFAFISLFLLSGSIYAQEHVAYKIPETLNVLDFQTPEDRELIVKFNTVTIPTIMRRLIQADDEYIIPWLRKTTADTHDLQVTLQIVRKGVLVTDRQFDWVKREVEICAEILNLSPTPRVFIADAQEGMKAYATNFKEPIIILPSELIDKSNIYGLRFAIGRQMGHIMCDHVFYQILSSGGLDSLEFILGKWVSDLIGSFLDKVTNLLLVDWVLASEISADRAGLIACQNLQEAQNALINFNLAMSVDKIHLDIEDYIEQAAAIQARREAMLKNLPESVQKGYLRWQNSNRLAVDHPFVPKRIRALREYAESEAYQKLFP